MLTYPVNVQFGITRCFKSGSVSNKDKVDDTILFKFSPKLNLQRYITVFQVIKDCSEKEDIKSVTEFGSGNFIFFHNFLQQIRCLEVINQIDTDIEKIESAIHIIAWKRYRIIDCIPRKPFKVNIFHGNVALKDYRTLNSDIVVGIELIEHLSPQEFELLPSVVFGFIKPKIVIFTTPNHDFNKLFLKQGFRHSDHKFEFSRKEFQNWTNGIVQEYSDYKAKIYGIGEPPKGEDAVGYCSQMVIFRKVSNCCTNFNQLSNVVNYNLIGSYQY
ncbi:hypothetical protein PGB90_010135 [Kerria lacca]